MDHTGCRKAIGGALRFTLKDARWGGVPVNELGQLERDEFFKAMFNHPNETPNGK